MPLRSLQRLKCTYSSLNMFKSFGDSLQKKQSFPNANIASKCQKRLLTHFMHEVIITISNIAILLNTTGILPGFPY